MSLEQVLADQDDVLTLAQAEAGLTTARVRWLVESGRWQRPVPGVLVAHSGPVTGAQRLWVDLLSAGRGAVIAGDSALLLHGLRGVDVGPTGLLVPHGRQVTGRRDLRIHSSRRLDDDVQSSALPPRTKAPRSAIDAASWARTDREARLFLVTSVQQRLVTGSVLLQALDHLGNVRRHRLIQRTCVDLVGGAHTLAEIDLARLCRRYGLPRVSRQVPRSDSAGRRRWLDAYFDAYSLVVEVDGAAHMQAGQWWADLDRSNDLAIQQDSVLRFPSWKVREHPREVANVIAAALRARGWRGSPLLGQQPIAPTAS